jgi:hypothetical protein
MKKVREILYVFLFCVPFAILVYAVAHIGILIFNLIKFMNTKKINDIEVKDYIELSSTLRQTDIENAKQVLKSAGYFVDNLWHVSDVKENYECTDEQAQQVLSASLQNEATMEQIWFAIHFEGGFRNLKSIEQ